MIRAITSRPTEESTSPVSGFFHGVKHSVQFYTADPFLVESVTHYLGSALRNGGVAVIIATRAHLESIAGRLQKMDIDFATARRVGRYVEYDAQKLLGELVVDGRPDQDVFLKFAGNLMEQAAQACPDSQPRLAVFGEMVDLLCA